MGDGVVRTLQDWMQYMEERKARVREADAQAKKGERQPADAAARAEQSAATPSETVAPESPSAQHVVAPPTSGGGTAPIALGLPARPYGGSLARGVEHARDRMRRALHARQAGQAELPLGLPSTERPRGARRSADETRDELIERLLDPELTLQETAKLLNVCPTTVRRYTNRGVLNHFRTPGNQRRFRLSDVLEFMGRQQQSRGQST
ncbi:MAG: helix-turn-helix domain-containing protein [Armatimonadota bacterium]